MIVTSLAIAGVLLALLPAATFLRNLPLFRFPNLPKSLPERSRQDVSILIPARDEQGSIAASVRSALDSRGVTVEVVVLDDDSSDQTPQIVQGIAEKDSRVRYVRGNPLPAGWNGKQHACKQLADAASYARLVFMDADVRLAPETLARLIDQQDAADVALLSAFPHQQTGTLLEKGIIPLMHYVLLGYLPFDRMRESTHPAYAAGCGQLFITRQEAYQAMGTHAMIRGSRHDGLKLPRAFRQADLSTDVLDGTELAECRMYTSAPEVIRGVLKNAVEGIANPKLIVPFTVLLLGGSVLPFVSLAWSIADRNLFAAALSIVGIALGHLPRAVAAVQCKQSIVGLILHAPAVALFVTLQWIALLQHVTGHQVAWRGRVDSPDAAESATDHGENGLNDERPNQATSTT